MEATTQVIFKVFYTEKPTIHARRVSFPSVADVSYSALYSKLSQVFSIKEFKLHYTDADEDKFVIENDSDLKEAIDYFSSQNVEGKLVIRLSLEKATSSVNAAPQSSSTEAAQTSNNENDEQYNQEEFPFEKVINTSIKTVQEMVHNFVTQLSTAIERDLSNLNLSGSKQAQQTDSNEGSASTFKDTKRASSFQAFTETRQVPKSESQKSSEPVVHYGVICDCCKSIIRGTRWKCTDCPNYDLCQACKPKSPSIHAHPFRQIPFPINSSNHSNTFNTHSATCDYCELVIVGVRHKCINCPDFDLCHNCIALAPNRHPYHTFMQIHRPGEPEIKILDVAFHPGIRCDGCGKPINGVRFKCGNCADFDLCGNCEASPTNKHDPDHVFIKFRRPVPSPISASTSLLPNFYSRSEHKIYRPRCRQPLSHQRSDNKEMKEFVGSKSSESTGNKSSESTGNKSSESIGSKSSEKSSQNSFNSIVESINIEPSTDRPVISRAPIDLYRTSNISSSSLSRNQEQKQVQIPTFSSTSGVPTSPSIDATEEIKPETERQIKVEPSLDAHFIEDVNIPDGTVLEPQTQFHKIWRMINNGNVNWPESTTLQHVGGSPMVNEAMPSSESGKVEFKVGSHEVGKSVCVAADLRAPSEPGKYISRWCLTDGQGNVFGHQVWCEIIVESDEQSSNMSSSSMIFPVLNYDQKSAFVQSNPVSEQSSYISNSITSSEINLIQNEDEDPFQDPISPDLTVAELTKNPMETENNVETFDSDEESEISSIASSDDSSQDFIVVEKDSDDEMELSQSQQSLFGRQTSRENVRVTRSE